MPSVIGRVNVSFQDTPKKALIFILYKQETIGENSRGKTIYTRKENILPTEIYFQRSSLLMLLLKMSLLGQNRFVSKLTSPLLLL